MNFKKPKFWDYKKPNIIAYLLLPFTLLITLNNFISKIYPKKKFNKIKKQTHKKKFFLLEKLLEN